jgi:twinkle protein
MTDISTISRMLADRALSVAEHLLPGGRKEGQEWRAGSLGGDKGQSLGVHLAGTKAGVWSDFQSGESGADLIDLWKAVKGCSLVEALDQARGWLGVSRPTFERDTRPTYKRPQKPQCTAPTPPVLDYLREVRNVPADVIERYRVAADGSRIIFPFLLPDGTLALAKAREAVDGAKPIPTAPECEPILFGWQAMPADSRIVVITEGEIDALSWAAYGYPAMSVPFGGGKGAKQKWIESEFDRLDRFQTIYLSLDMDPTGDEAAEEIASRLGRHRCLRVKLPRKDANECLVDGVSQADMDAVIANAENLDPAGLQRPSDYAARVAHLFWPAEGERPGYSTPYGKIKNKVHFRPSDVTLWTGASGAGKSQVISDSIPHWITEGARICVASFEMPPAQTLRRLVKQTGDIDRPTIRYIDKVLAFLDRGLLLYEKVGKSGVPQLLEVFDYARAKYGCDMFVIDSLLRLGIASDDYAGQEKAVYEIVDWTVRHKVHTHLVAHARKGEKGGGPPEIEDVKGASEIGANAANIIAVWRNRDHEDRLAKAKTDDERAELNEKPGVIMNIAKQRHGDFEGKIGLWFDQQSYRYHSSFDRSVWGRRYFDDTVVDAERIEVGF